MRLAVIDFRGRIDKRCMPCWLPWTLNKTWRGSRRVWHSDGESDSSSIARTDSDLDTGLVKDVNGGLGD